MDTDIVEKIRNRVRKLSNSQLPSDLTPRQLELITKLQSYWKMVTARKQYQKMLRRKEKRKFILLELEKTEKDYIDDIRIVIEHVMKQVEEILDEEMYKMLFINLEEIIEIHAMFYERLANAMQSYNHNTTKISELILYLTPRLKDPYQTFCLEYSKSHQILRLLNISNTQFKTHINNLRKEGLLKGELASYLIKPVQRICKYSLLLRELIKNTDEDHADYQELEKANEAIKNIVQGTNDKIEEFLCQERMNELGAIFNRLDEEDNKFVHESKVEIIEKEMGEGCESDIYIFTKFIIVAQDKKELLRFPLDENSTVKENPTGKYFKNIIVVASKKKLLTLSCQNTSKKIELLDAFTKSLSQSQDQNRIDVDIEGAEEREKLFSKYTVYIVRIKTKGIDMKIFPRFSELIELEKDIRKEIKNIDMPHLEKDGWYTTLKTKTIEKRMFIIREFLLNILNDSRVRNVAKVFTELGLECLLETSVRKKQDSESSTISVAVNIAGWQQLNVWVSDKSKIVDLKNKIVGLLNLEHPQEYELFVTKDRMKKLIYEDEMVTKVSKQCGGFFSKIFEDKTVLAFQRYYYLSPEQELQLYKKDPVRTNLELEIIKSEIDEYKMDYELLMTILALFAKHMNIQISSDKKMKKFLASMKFGSLDHLVFRQYCYEIEDVVKNEPTPIPLIIVKTINKADLYTASQYIVEAYQKTLKEVRKELLLEENMILAIKPARIMFLTSERQTIFLLQYQEIKELLVYPTSIVFLIDKVKSEIRFNTVQSYEISKLIGLYSKSSLDTKHFNYRTSIQ